MKPRRSIHPCKERLSMLSNLLSKKTLLEPRTLVTVALICLLVSLALVFWPDSASAQQTGTAQTGTAQTSSQAVASSQVVRLPATRDPFGERTRTLLAVQRDGRLASPSPQALSGKVQGQIYQRYVDSFGHPIPERYIETGFGED
ncbi:hypothetical protein C6W88_00560 [Halomonas litopenaei]|uniref:DUF3613 domain-containing protein n=1 Tax=Halomonas litopenaei TaxID=2109328 RepID=A0ABX5IZC2_9GAMM|nr:MULTISPECIES: DUF3613 domain-containing protein [Halomonas]MBR9771956.1 DUF3613 domain-containing protein [Gammaproteobacteria bacterium]PTL93154.1 hypothetical protein C6W89_04590 [Halomonas sp. SYSU XM8]PTL95942.1 hypothetical protein C6W88_00560 [Halomonas litopenaei]RQW69421.1 DUF3613 domain-containing protein [Halomonas sp. YLB-10]